MDVTVQAIESKARRAYEWARLRRALLGATPILLLVGLSTLTTTRLVATALVGAALLAAGVGALWLGQGFQRTLIPGVLAGTLPLATALCATRFGHVCFGDACMSVCLAASALGGVGAGLLIGRWAMQKRPPVALLAAACVFGLLTGAMGSTCTGTTGVAALVLGFAAALGVQQLRRAGQQP